MNRAKMVRVEKLADSRVPDQSPLTSGSGGPLGIGDGEGNGEGEAEAGGAGLQPQLSVRNAPKTSIGFR